LAVSGQNVAFVLVLAGPLARRLRLWPRLGTTLAVVAMFGLVTRFEPSVLRAGAMAALAAVTVTIGRPTSRLRVLALAATALLIVDPLLVHSVGFRLSVAAAAAIVVLAPPIAAVLPGPRWLAAPLGVTVAAQLGVAPVLLTTFGPLPVASLPANLLAVPAAGAVMVWGLTAGLLAGVVGGTAAAVLHLPTRLLLAWIEEVASRAAAAPLGELEVGHVAAIAGGLGLAGLARRAGRPSSWRRAGMGLAAAGLAAAVLAAQAPPSLRTALGPGLVRWHSAGVDVVALGGGGWPSTPGAAETLEGLRRAGVGTLALLVVVDGSVPPAVVDAVADRHPAGAVLVPGDLSGRPEVAVVAIPPGGVELDVGPMVVAIVRGEDRWVVEARPARGDKG
jgi:ComEC/Rec2-related protein